MKTPEEALEYIHSISWKGSVPGLSRTRELLQRMGDPQKRLKFVHIAGTNGKGSTAAMLERIFRTAGYRTGLYTSPYITCFNERMQVEGLPISNKELVEITAFVRPHAEAMADTPTEFELVTAIAMEYFARAHCDIVMLEVGMGGALDSTNVIDRPEVGVICNIGLDHTAYLGNTLSEIAQAKAGILKGGDGVFYPCPEEVEQVFADRCAATQTRLHKADFDSLQLKDRNFSGQRFHHGSREDLELSLLGAHQLKNAAVVLKTVEVLQEKGWKIPEEALRRGLKETRWPGRFELLREDPVFFIDGGHNPQCIEALAENIRQYLPGRPLTVLTGVMADKDAEQMYPYIAPYAESYFTVRPENPRAMEAEALAQLLRPYGKPVTACKTVEEGVRRAIEAAGPTGTVLAFGSLYMLGQIRDAVEKSKIESNKNRKLALRPVCPACREELSALQVKPEQEQWIATNARSLAQWDALPRIARPFGLYAEGQAVGFAMLAVDLENEDPEDRYWIWRLMIHKDFQDKGYGAAALEALIAYLRAEGADQITLSTKENNQKALSLYHRFGFRENGEKNGEEIILKLRL